MKVSKKCLPLASGSDGPLNSYVCFFIPRHSIKVRIFQRAYVQMPNRPPVAAWTSHHSYDHINNLTTSVSALKIFRYVPLPLCVFSKPRDPVDPGQTRASFNILEPRLLRVPPSSRSSANLTLRAGEDSLVGTRDASARMLCNRWFTRE